MLSLFKNLPILFIPLLKNKILIIGHYSDIGMKVKLEVFEQNYDSTRMFWLITKKIAYGGRAAILPLLKSILTSESRIELKYDPSSSCDNDCKTSRAFFIRANSLLFNSEKITLKSKN